MGIARHLEVMCLTLFQREKVEEANDIMRMMFDAYRDSSNKEIKEHVSILRDRIRLQELKFESLVEGLKIEDSTNARLFGNAVQALTSDSTVGRTILDELLEVGRYLEGISKYNHAAKIYHSMSRHMTTHPNREIAKFAKTESEKAFKRLAQIGKPIELVGRNVFGDEIEPELYKDKVVLLYFWSATSPTSLQEMARLLELYRKYPREKFEIIAISIDELSLIHI